jgi:hypothetical protein
MEVFTSNFTNKIKEGFKLKSHYSNVYPLTGIYSFVE